MSVFNHFYNEMTSSGTAKCAKCGKEYYQTIEEQVPGFRIKDFDICPYCGYDNGSSMEVEFTNRKIED